MNYNQNRETYAQFLYKVFNLLYKHKIDVTNLHLDHLGYQTESLKNYEKLKKSFSKVAYLLDESIINQRKIAVYILEKPMVYLSRIINCLELMAPKEEIIKRGFEHAEFVVTDSLNQFMEKYYDVDFDKSSLNKFRNPNLKIKGEDFTIKFHTLSLEELVKKEKRD